MKKILVILFALLLTMSCVTFSEFFKQGEDELITDEAEDCFCTFEDKDCECDAKDN